MHATPASRPAATARGKKTSNAPHAVLRARYDAAAAQLVLDLANGVRVGLPARAIDELCGLTDAELAAVEVSPLRDGLLWQDQDVAISVPGLLDDFFRRE